jgi:DNA-binding NarL/FixJ family response regulator
LRLRLLVADDHQLMLAAVRLALRDAADIDIVGEARTGAEVLPLVGRTSPDVVLLDLRMPGMDGLRCLELLRERYPSVRSVVFSGSDDPSAVQACEARGAAAFVPKTIGPSELEGVIREAAVADAFFSISDRTVVSAVQSDGHLTPRETEILQAVAGGMPNKLIARELRLSEQTIKYHLTNIYRKLRVTSRTEAVCYGYEHGLIQTPVLRMAASPA